MPEADPKLVPPPLSTCVRLHHPTIHHRPEEIYEREAVLGRDAARLVACMVHGQLWTTITRVTQARDGEWWGRGPPRLQSLRRGRGSCMWGLKGMAHTVSHPSVSVLRMPPAPPSHQRPAHAARPTLPSPPCHQCFPHSGQGCGCQRSIHGWPGPRFRHGSPWLQEIHQRE